MRKMLVLISELNYRSNFRTEAMNRQSQWAVSDLHTFTDNIIHLALQCNQQIRLTNLQECRHWRGPVTSQSRDSHGFQRGTKWVTGYTERVEILIAEFYENTVFIVQTSVRKCITQFLRRLMTFV